MKRYLKNFDLNEEFIEKAICLCLDPTPKRKNRWVRRDTSQLIAEYLVKEGKCSLEKRKALANDIFALAQIDYFEVRKFSKLLAKHLYMEIKNREIELKPIRNVVRYDHTCGKKRVIGIASMKQQCLDWVVSEALDEFFNDKIHPCQESGIRTHGPLHAAKRISRWIQKEPKKMKYCVQGDIQKFYPSIDHDILKGIFEKYIINEDILYLINLLIDSYGERGISIGSYLALRMANAMMGLALYWLDERNFYYDKRGRRKGKRYTRLIVYTDNISIFGANKTQVKKAMQDLAEHLCANYKLTIKSPWIFRNLEKDKFFDVAGFKIYSDHITIRKRSFKRIRNEAMRNKKEFNTADARSIASRWGQLKWTNSYNFCRKYKYFSLLTKAKRTIRNEAKDIVYLDQE